MGASVRIEGEAFSDGRYEHLGMLMGTSRYDALGRMTVLWRQCTQEKTYVLPESFVRVYIDPEKLCESRLGERVETGIRIKGTRGRIEWLEKLRKNGRKGGRPRKPNGFGLDNQMQTKTEPPPNPPTPIPTPIPTPSKNYQNKNSDTQNAVGPGEYSLEAEPAKPKRGRPSKPKPSDWSDAERESALFVLERLGAQNGVRYSGAHEHVRLVVGQLRHGVTEVDLRAVIGYCAYKLGWKADEERAVYLRPETLFGPKTIAKYLDPARQWIASLPEDERPQPRTKGSP